jgi:hypothetical protein
LAAAVAAHLAAAAAADIPAAVAVNILMVQEAVKMLVGVVAPTILELTRQML